MRLIVGGPISPGDHVLIDVRATILDAAPAATPLQPKPVYDASRRVRLLKPVYLPAPDHVIQLRNDGGNLVLEVFPRPREP